MLITGASPGRQLYELDSHYPKGEEELEHKEHGDIPERVPLVTLCNQADDDHYFPPRLLCFQVDMRNIAIEPARFTASSACLACGLT